METKDIVMKIEHQCKNCEKKRCHFLKCAKTHFQICQDFSPKCVASEIAHKKSKKEI